MSSSIAIPKRRRGKQQLRGPAESNSSLPSRYGSSYESVAASPSSTASAGMGQRNGERRESLMSPEFASAEYTVVNIGHSEVPRLITCVKASQGFDWNQEIFFPSYMDHHRRCSSAKEDLENKKDPIEDIVVTDEEVRAMFPQ